MLGHVATVETARDLDVLRAALGDAKLHYLGLSYGSYLGAVYAEQFPDKVGRLVLDAAVDPRMWPASAETRRVQAAGFETALDAFLANCVQLTDCPLGPDTATVRQQLEALVERTEQAPLSWDNTRKATQTVVISGMSLR